jgi:DNA polymerase-4
MGRWVLHVDLDQFIAAVEVLRHPELRGRPVVVGGDGDPTKRGVVSTASYEAREHGVHSGLPLRTAARRLPDAVFLPVDREAYDEVSASVMDVLRTSGAVVEVLGWDEAFLGLDTSDPEAFARIGCVLRRNWTARWGSGRTSCRPRSPPGSASRPGYSG